MPTAIVTVGRLLACPPPAARIADQRACLLRGKNVKKVNANGKCAQEIIILYRINPLQKQINLNQWDE